VENSNLHETFDYDKMSKVVIVVFKAMRSMSDELGKNYNLDG
jgi:hypothetical protein